MLNPDMIKACSYCRWFDMDMDENGEMKLICEKVNECKPGYQNECKDYEPMC